MCASDEKDWKFSMVELNESDFHDRTPAQEQYILDSSAEAPKYSQNFKTWKLIEVLRKNSAVTGQLTQVTLLDILLAEVKVPHFKWDTNT